jgi:hypothetical protein
VSKRRDQAKPVHDKDEVTKPDLVMPPPPAPRLPPLDLAAVESELGWWEAIQGSDVRLFEAWLAHHGAIVIAARTIDRFDAFFAMLASRRSVTMTDHEVGFIFRRKA